VPVTSITAPLALCALVAAADPAPPAAPRTELNFVPLVGGDSDVGVGGGVVGDLVRLAPDAEPFRWRVEVAAFITFKPGQGTEKVSIPFQDYYVLFTLPQLMASRRLRLEVRPAFTSEATQNFYGVGNASPEPPAVASDRQRQYGRSRVALRAAARMEVVSHVFLRAAIDATHNWLTIRPDSILADQRAAGPDRVRALLDGPDRHTLTGAEVAVQWDSRDSEIVTRHGSFHEVRFRASPRLAPNVPFDFGQLGAAVRFYRSPFRRLVLSARAVGDVLFGNVPFYELTRVEDMSVVGGGKGIRGVPGQRYYGKMKVFGNLETRLEVWSFTLFDKPFVLSTAAFADGGRVWAEFFRAAPELDGRGLGLKYGLGGGLRLQEGTTFILRFDIAWSPDARPIGVYFNAGQLF
jgi:hypothetical protein